MPYLGTHVSAAGGLPLVFPRAAGLGAQAIQLFTRNQRQWSAPPVSAEEAAAFRDAWSAWDPAGPGSPRVCSHDSYLVNLASKDPEIRSKSLAAFGAELARCQALGVPYVVMHPGAHLGDGVEPGLIRVAAALDECLERAAADDVIVLLENTAGQGTTLGADFKELARIIELSRHPERLGVCLDTCHAFAAGFELRTEEGYAETMRALDAAVGLDRVRFFHLNDAKAGLGSHLDRHEHIGEGELGDAAFARLLNDPRFADRPMVLETPKGKDDVLDRKNLAHLRSLLRG